MITRERLEVALLAQWGREEMAVYADYLQSIGDPRGEVIAIDLVNLDTVDEAAWRARRHTALVDWLGEDLATRFGGQIFQGFIQEANTDETLLASPAGEFVRAFRGSESYGVERLSALPRPWLTQLAITASPPTGPVLSQALVDKLVASTSRLDAIVFRGARIAKRFAHRTVRSVRLEGEVLETLEWNGQPISPPPLGLSIERVRDAPDSTRLYVASDLAVLDEPTLRPHVTHIRLSVVLDRGSIHRALAFPRLTTIEVAGSDREVAAVRATVAQVRPEVRVELHEGFRPPPINPWR